MYCTYNIACDMLKYLSKIVLLQLSLKNIYCLHSFIMCYALNLKAIKSKKNSRESIFN